MKEFVRKFDERCVNWDRSPEFNKHFIKNVQTLCNEVLFLKGYLFLNEVYELLGLEKTMEGQIYGWAHDVSEPGDYYVDFGDLIPDKNGSITLTFRTDGIIIGLKILKRESGE